MAFGLRANGPSKMKGVGALFELGTGQETVSERYQIAHTWLNSFG